jgi:hypothetical protein
VSQRYVTDVEAFDKRAVALGLWKLAPWRSGQLPKRIPNNTRIAKRLHRSATTVAAARRGEPVPDSFVAAVVAGFGVTVEQMFRPAATAPERAS